MDSHIAGMGFLLQPHFVILWFNIDLAAGFLQFPVIAPSPSYCYSKQNTSVSKGKMTWHYKTILNWSLQALWKQECTHTHTNKQHLMPQCQRAAPLAADRDLGSNMADFHTVFLASLALPLQGPELGWLDSGGDAGQLLITCSVGACSLAQTKLCCLMSLPKNTHWYNWTVSISILCIEFKCNEVGKASTHWPIYPSACSRQIFVYTCVWPSGIWCTFCTLCFQRIVAVFFPFYYIYYG